MQALSLGFLSIAMLTTLASCVKKEQNEQSKAQCEANAAYMWIDDRCVARNSLLGKEAECKEKGAAFIWLNNSCLTKEGILTSKTRCEAKQDGSRWEVDPITGTGTCLGPTQTVTAIAECEKQAGHKWDDIHQQCLSPEAQACNLGGDIWVDNQCLNRTVYQQREACLGRHDGSEWISLRCVTLAERHCAERGVHYSWQANGEGSGECSAKGFLEYCQDSKAEAAIKHTVSVLLGQIDRALAKDCAAAADKLNTMTALTLAGQRLTNLLPLNGFDNLTGLDLQGNAVVALAPIQALTKLQTLNLTDNRIQDLSPLKELRSLRDLHLGGNDISDLAPLAGLPELRSLYLNKNKITNIVPLANVSENSSGGLAHLAVLSLDDNCGLTNVNALQRFTQLTHLSLKLTGMTKDQLPSFGPSTSVDHSKCP